jgi:hypothetical protein
MGLKDLEGFIRHSIPFVDGTYRVVPQYMDGESKLPNGHVKVQKRDIWSF